MAQEIELRMEDTTIERRSKRHVKSHRKSKDGCRPCKDRRVKCDETRPRCLRCIKGNHACRYVPVKVWMFEPRKSTEATTVKSQSAALDRPRLSLASLDGNNDELRAFALFRERTAPAFAWESPVSQEFFTKFVPQVAVGEKAVWHIVIAMASRFEQHGQADERRRKQCQLLSLNHYTSAVALLARNLQNLRREVAVLCSMLLTGHDNLHENALTTGLRHLIYGLGIIQQEQQVSIGPCEDYLRSFTRPMMAELALLTVACSIPPASAQLLAITSVECPILPPAFESLSQAKAVLFDILRWRYYALMQRPALSSSLYITETARGLLAAWYELVGDYKLATFVTQPSEAFAATNMLFQFKLLAMGLEESSPIIAEQSKISTLSMDLVHEDRAIVTLWHPPERFPQLMSGGRPKETDLDIWPHATARRVSSGQYLVKVAFTR